ncbi:MAG: hypothetical protein ACYTBS_07490 [Planctomycetota bacterium]|jgi:hypothetical protein
MAIVAIEKLCAVHQLGSLELRVLLVSVVIAVGGCSRTEHRLQADLEAYDVIAERNADPRWHSSDYSIEIDPRSRYFDPCDPDHPPMPQDDPSSHQYMRLVNGIKGWKHWYDNGQRKELENPAWRQELADYVDVNEAGSVMLNIDSALELAYVHSPDHQRQLETLYLSALDVTAERFRLDTQFFGGYGASYDHANANGSESDQLTVGRPSAGNPVLQAQRSLASAGQLLVGFANSFVFEFAGKDTSFTASVANFSLVQPLLRGAGRDIALEQLTSAERALLASLRAYHQYRQGFFTQVAVGELGVAGPRRGGPGTVIAGFSGQGFAGGYIGLLQQLQRIRNTEDNLSLQERTLARLIAFQEIGVIDMVQVDQFWQSIQAERANLLQIRNSFELTLDGYKTRTLGLPPDLPVELDDSLIRQFQLVAGEATQLEDAIVALQDRVGALTDSEGTLPADADVATIRQVLDDAAKLVEPIQGQLDNIQPDLDRMDAQVPVREQAMTDDQRQQFREDRGRLGSELAELKRKFDLAKPELTVLQDGLADQTKDITLDGTVKWLRVLLRIVQDSMLVQARARLETVSIETIELDSQEAFATALANRMDFMNGRAALVDRWRAIQVSADALQSSLSVTVNGELRTTRNNAVDFGDPARNMHLGLEFDAPFTRLLERNAYRQSLINYQQDRRNFIQSHDAVHLGLRGLLRQIEQLRLDLEIQRFAVTIAIRRVDMTRAAFYAPVRPPQPGQRPAQFGPTAAQNLLGALASLRNTQNNFMGVWLSYYAARMRLARELGTMKLDRDGHWIEHPDVDKPRIAFDSNPMEDRASIMPPDIPGEWIELADQVALTTEHPDPDALAERGIEEEINRVN